MPLSRRTVYACVLSSAVLFLLSAADVAIAQTITANGSTNAMAIYRGDTVTIDTARGAATATTTDWVGVYYTGTANNSWLDWYYLNGEKTAPPVPHSTATFTFKVNQPAGYDYEFRYFANNTSTALLATSGVVSVKPALLTANGVAPPDQAGAAPTVLQAGVLGAPGHPQDWVGLFRIGDGDSAYLSWKYLNGAHTAPSTGLNSATVPITVPNVRGGPYELRLFYANGMYRLATSGSIVGDVATRAVGGDAHTLVVKSNGSLWATGRNNASQLGEGTTQDALTPIAVGIDNIVSVAAGISHSVALTTTGSVYVWGANDVGQLGDGTWTPRNTPTALSLTNVIAIAAGDHHSVALTSSGQVFTWGLNGSGQLGNGTTNNSNVPIQLATGALSIAAGDRFTFFVKADRTVWGTGDNEFGALGDGTFTGRTSPVQMSNVSGGVAVRAGKKHALVLMANGAVLGTGQNSFGQVGDNSLTNRSTPVPVATVVNVADISAGDDFSLALDEYGVVWAWGNNASGQLGTSTPTYRTAPATITGLNGVRYIGAGKSHSIAIKTDETVMTFGANASGQLGDGTTTNHATPLVSEVFSRPPLPTPTLSISTGTFTSSFNVVVSSPTSGITMHYTRNGIEPTQSDPPVASGSSIVVDHSQTLKVKAWKTGWSPSPVVAATYTMNFGTLAAPTASPGEGVYADAQTVTLSALSGATIRYTVDGSEPTAVSNLYVTPFQVGNVTIKSRAFHPDWTPSPVAAGQYTIDAVAPTITSSRFPAAVGGWHNSPTTISFSCQDDIGIASCSSSMTVSTAGAGQQFVGTAIDQAGREATVTVAVNLDSTAPTVAITTPSAPLTTSNSSVDLVGEVGDALSGLAAATCNGQTAPIVSGVVSCTVSLGPGRNDLLLAARDAAGNVTSKSVRVMRIGTATAIGLTPNARTVLVDETTALTLTDDFGTVVTAATWSSSDPAIVSVSTDDPPVLTALQSGTATITATKNGLTANATLTVAGGPTLSYGTTRWSSSGAPGFSVSRSIVANRVDLSVPDLFTVERAGTTTIVRGMTSSGDVLWTQQAPGEPLMGDSFGALVAGTFTPAQPLGLEDPAYGQQITSYDRFAGPDGVPSWRYESMGGLSGPAQAADGTIYAVERYSTGVNNPNGFPIYETQVIVIDGNSGSVAARYPLAREQRRNANSCATWQASPHTRGPIVGTDGHGYLLVRKWTHASQCSSNLPQHVGVELLRISPAGSVTATSVYSQQCTAGSGSDLCDRAPQLKELMPDGIGGTLVRAQYNLAMHLPMEMRLTRILDGAVRFSNVVDDDERITMIGDAGTAFLVGDDVRAVDVTDWTIKWVKSNSPLEPVVALPNAKVAMQNLATGQLIEISETGVEGQSAAFGGRWGYQSAFGLWTEVSSSTGSLSARFSLPLNEAPNSFRSWAAIGTQQNAPGYKRVDTIEKAALEGLDYIYDLTTIAGWEFGGVVCGQPGGYWWSSIVTNEQPGSVITIDSPGLTPEQRAHLPECPPAPSAQPIASFHTHVFNGGEPYPSGWILGTPPPNDLTNAAVRPDLLFFIRTPNRSVDPTGLFSIRYQAIEEEGGVWSARNNMFRWNGVGWLPYSPQ